MGALSRATKVVSDRLSFSGQAARKLTTILDVAGIAFPCGIKE